jgi:small-conductance mechanosensitive channel
VLEPGSFARLLTVDGWVVLIYEFGPPLVRALLLAIGTWIAARVARKSFSLAARRADAHAQLLFGRIINIVIIGLGVATIFDTVGVPLTTFVTVLGVAGLGISLAMQDVLKSFVAGTFLLFERPFRIGDEISVKDQRGIVENIGIRTTRLRNADNVQFIIPNAVVFAEVVQNRTNEVKKEPAEPPAESVVAPVDGATSPTVGTPSAAAPVPTSPQAAAPAPIPGTATPELQAPPAVTPPVR